MGNKISVVNEHKKHVCIVCNKEKIFITFDCGHKICINCLHAMKFFAKETMCVVCNKETKIEKVSWVTL